MRCCDRVFRQLIESLAWQRMLRAREIAPQHLSDYLREWKWSEAPATVRKGLKLSHQAKFHLRGVTVFHRSFQDFSSNLSLHHLHPSFANSRASLQYCNINESSSAIYLLSPWCKHPFTWLVRQPFILFSTSFRMVSTVSPFFFLHTANFSSRLLLHYTLSSAGPRTLTFQSRM